MALQHHLDDGYDAFLKFAALAESLNDTLDFSYERAGYYYESGKTGLARKEIVKRIDTLQDSYALKDKATLMLKLGMDIEALDAYKIAITDTS